MTRIELKCSRTLLVVGAPPNFIKIAPLLRELRGRERFAADVLERDLEKLA